MVPEPAVPAQEIADDARAALEEIEAALEDLPHKLWRPPRATQTRVVQATSLLRKVLSGS